MTDNTLPDKPSELLRVGLEDFAFIEADPRYVPDLGSYHMLIDGLCHVCVAGAVMANRLDVPLREYRTPDSFDEDARDKLDALDMLRAGNVFNAGFILGNRRLQDFDDRQMPDYEEDPAAWWAAENQLVTDLEKAGL